jgi:hypothetical protein
VGVRTKLLRRYVWRVLVVVAVAVIAGWLALARPWEKEVWISTTPDSFVLTVPDSRHVAIDPNTTLIGITPAPWPHEAGQIMRAARRGQIVHIMLVTKYDVNQFDITGVSASGDLIVDIKSMSDSKRVKQLLESGRESLP